MLWLCGLLLPVLLSSPLLVCHLMYPTNIGNTSSKGPSKSKLSIDGEYLYDLVSYVYLYIYLYDVCVCDLH